jgi:hypothetical protein
MLTTLIHSQILPVAQILQRRQETCRIQFTRKLSLYVLREFIASFSQGSHRFWGEVHQNEEMNGYRKCACCSASITNEVTKQSCVDGWVRTAAEVRREQCRTRSENE